LDSQTLGILLMFLGLPLIISIPVTALIWGSHKRKLEAMRLEAETHVMKNHADIDRLEAKLQILQKEISEIRMIQ